MVAPTAVRAGRITALLVGIQSAKGTAVSNFSTGSSARLWTDSAFHRITPRKSDPAGYLTLPQLAAVGRHNIGGPIEGALACKATPTSLEYLLRSCWGAYSGGAWALSTQINEWMSLGWVESVLSGSTQYFHRATDAFVSRVVIKASISGMMTLEADYLAEDDDEPVAINALAGITLPSSPMAVGDKNIFPGRMVRLFRDPSGDNQEISLRSIEVTIENGALADWDMLRQKATISRGGFPGPRVGIGFTGHVSAETWEAITASRAGTLETYRLQATAQASAKTFTMNLYSVDCEVEQIGHSGLDYVTFNARGQAHRSAAGNFVSMTLS